MQARCILTVGTAQHSEGLGCRLDTYEYWSSDQPQNTEPQERKNKKTKNGAQSSPACIIQEEQQTPIGGFKVSRRHCFSFFVCFCYFGALFFVFSSKCNTIRHGVVKGSKKQRDVRTLMPTTETKFTSLSYRSSILFFTFFLLLLLFIILLFQFLFLLCSFLCFVCLISFFDWLCLFTL